MRKRGNIRLILRLRVESAGVKLKGLGFWRGIGTLRLLSSSGHVVRHDALVIFVAVLTLGMDCVHDILIPSNC